MAFTMMYLVDITEPEALVYELDVGREHRRSRRPRVHRAGQAWPSSKPPPPFPELDFHRHPVLPLWVLHTWMWKPNPTGTFSDWNPAVRPCPSGVPIFGVDLPNIDARRMRRRPCWERMRWRPRFAA